MYAQLSGTQLTSACPGSWCEALKYNICSTAVLFHAQSRLSSNLPLSSNPSLYSNLPLCYNPPAPLQPPLSSNLPLPSTPPLSSNPPLSNSGLPQKSLVTRSADISVMLALRNSLSGAPASWNGSADPCSSWSRITCSGSPAAVVALDLGGQGVSGTLGAGTLALSSLQTLNLSINALSGTLPAGWGGLTAASATLKYLDVSANQFSGSIPTSTSALTALTAISLSSNLLGGSISPLIALPNSVTVGLSGNYGLCGVASGPLLTASTAGTGVGSASCNTTNSWEALAMRQLRDALIDVSGLILSTWAGDDPCAAGVAWTGVTCSSSGSGGGGGGGAGGSSPGGSGSGSGTSQSSSLASIVALALPAVLAGTLPAFALQKLTALTSLQLTSTLISSTLPSTLAFMTSLQALQLLSNSLSGCEGMRDLSSVHICLGLLLPLPHLAHPGFLPSALCQWVCGRSPASPQYRWRVTRCAPPSASRWAGPLPPIVFFDNNVMPSSISHLHRTARLQFSGSLPQALSALTLLQSLVRALLILPPTIVASSTRKFTTR